MPFPCRPGNIGYREVGRKLQSLLQDGLAQLTGCGLLYRLRRVCFSTSYTPVWQSSKSVQHDSAAHVIPPARMIHSMLGAGPAMTNTLANVLPAGATRRASCCRATGTLGMGTATAGTRATATAGDTATATATRAGATAATQATATAGTTAATATAAIACRATATAGTTAGTATAGAPVVSSLPYECGWTPLDEALCSAATLTNFGL